MYMFLPFLLPLLACASLFSGRTRWSRGLWLATAIVTVLWFFHHATDPLNFSF
ncbi:DUF5993 family protein [Caballeronia sp. LP003]|uniref:DUF5993 family protein n=1 Tax=Caballeronia sp. LP003 TaxID=3038551 RepID=UPI0028650C4E|nr:DUF5993 family protein [Caballeronia sp. LP003]MDR5785424.1 DUF5993 family protein [Caballeronia sp. LP003]